MNNQRSLQFNQTFDIPTNESKWSQSRNLRQTYMNSQRT